MIIVEKIINYKYLLLQESIQTGRVSENWQNFMQFSLLAVIVSLILFVSKVFMTMWVEMIQKPNFFKVCNGSIQEGRLEAATKLMTDSYAMVSVVITVIDTIVNSIYILIIMGVILMTLPECPGAVEFLFSGGLFGIYRGKLQARTDLLGAEAQTLQNILSTKYMVSTNVTDGHIKELDMNFWERIGFQCLKNTIQLLPEVIKVFAVVGLFYNITMMGMEDGEIYPYTFSVMTAYGYVVGLSGNISNLLEYVSKIVLYKKDILLKEIQKEIEQRRKEIVENSKFVRITEHGIVIETTFTAPVTRPNGETAFYKILKAIVLLMGQVIFLEGENGTGKSRLCKLLKTLLGGFAYDANTGMVEQLYKNFIRGKSPIDFNLIKYLASGLGLERIPNNKTEFYQMKCSAINSADRQMLIAMQILYFAIKDHEECKKTQLIILDEIFANLSLERTQKVLPFMMNELAKIGACTIIVSHSHKEEIKKYASAIWQMRNDGNEVIIEEKPL